MVMEAGLLVCAAFGALVDLGVILGVTSSKEEVSQLILDKMVSPVLPDTILMPKYHFATVVFAVVMAQIFYFAAL